MKRKKSGRARRIAVSLALEYPWKAHVEVFAGFQRYASEAGWISTLEPFAERALKASHAGGPCDGVIALATQSLAKAARRARVPVVNVQVNSPARDLPSVFPDYEAAGALAAEHLMTRGFRQFGFLGFRNNRVSVSQHKGFSERLKQEGFSCSVFRFGYWRALEKADRWEQAVAGLNAWVESLTPPVGIHVIEDHPCRFLIDACQAKGLLVPQDVAIVGAHDDLLICNSIAPTLTSIDLGHVEIGYRAAALLDRLMAGRKPPAGPELVASAKLVARQTTDSHAVNDPLVTQALRFIMENCHEPIRVSDVAAEMTTTRRTLERRFRESVGRSIAEEITRLRLNRVKRQMIETDLPLREIAKQAGFRTGHQFSKVFLRVEGMTPSQFRGEQQLEFLQRTGSSG